MQTIGTRTNARLCRLADEPEDYRRLGLDPETVEALGGRSADRPRPGLIRVVVFRRPPR